MASIRILHASDLHISRRTRIISAFDEEVSPAVALKNMVKSYLASPGRPHKAVVSTYDPTLLEHFAQRAFDDYTGVRLLGHRPVDAVLLTGDLATTGLRRDLERVRSFLEAAPPDPLLPTQAAHGRATIAPVRDGWEGRPGRPVWVLPGNHDRYRRSWLFPLDYSPGARKFDSVLSKHWGNPPYGQKWGKYVFEYPTLTQGELNLTIIAADFSLQSAGDRDGRWRCKYAQGRVYDKILTQLVAATDDVKRELKEEAKRESKKEPTHVVFWATHFPPEFPHEWSPREMQLNDESRLVYEAHRLGVRAVLSGHTHEQHVYTLSSLSTEVFCAGTLSQFHDPQADYPGAGPPENVFRVVEISDDPGRPAVSHEEYYFDPDESDYVRR